MNRREFLKVVAAGSALAVIPAAWGETATSAADLAGWFAGNFKEGFGAPWAFVEPRPAEYDEDINRPETWATERNYDGLTPYHTYKVLAMDERAGVAELQKLFGGFLAATPAIRGTPLWWRLPERIQVRPDSMVTEGRLLFSEEEVADWLANDLICSDAEFHYDGEGNIRELDTVTPCVRVRTRIAIPALQALGAQSDRSYAVGGWDSIIDVRRLA